MLLGKRGHALRRSDILGRGGDQLGVSCRCQAFGQAASHEPRPQGPNPEPYSQLPLTVPASAETAVTSAPVELATEVQAAIPEAVDNAPEPATEVQAETPFEPEKQVGIDRPIKNGLKKRAPSRGRPNSERKSWRLTEFGRRERA